jgi:hypothetical protein
MRDVSYLLNMFIDENWLPPHAKANIMRDVLYLSNMIAI